MAEGLTRSRVLGRGRRMGCGHLVARQQRAWGERCYRCTLRFIDPDDLDDGDAAWVSNATVNATTQAMVAEWLRSMDRPDPLWRRLLAYFGWATA